jgi:hypothetical protein
MSMPMMGALNEAAPRQRRGAREGRAESESCNGSATDHDAGVDDAGV